VPSKKPPQPHAGRTELSSKGLKSGRRACMHNDLPLAHELALDIDDKLVHGSGYEGDNNETGQHQREIEYLKAVDDQIAQAYFGDQKLADDYAYPGHADVHFQRGDNRRKRGGQYRFAEHILAAAAEGAYHFRI